MCSAVVIFDFYLISFACSINTNNGTSGCPTAGGVYVTITGQKFKQPINVFLGGKCLRNSDSLSASSLIFLRQDMCPNSQLDRKLPGMPNTSRCVLHSLWYILTNVSIQELVEISLSSSRQLASLVLWFSSSHTQSRRLTCWRFVV